MITLYYNFILKSNMTCYLVHYYDSSRGSQGGSYHLYKTLDQAVDYAVNEYNLHLEHEPLYCTEDKCPLELPIEDQKKIVCTELEKTGSVIYPSGSCLEGLDFMRIVRLELS
jgi:hypothetical protein